MLHHSCCYIHDHDHECDHNPCHRCCYHRNSRGGRHAVDGTSVAMASITWWPPTPPALVMSTQCCLRPRTKHRTSDLNRLPVGRLRRPVMMLLVAYKRSHHQVGTHPMAPLLSTARADPRSVVSPILLLRRTGTLAWSLGHGREGMPLPALCC